ncbi:hypothetical protein D0859_12410 [Hortaea werneckii]|uniref:Uncharacterized protein n=1 Tax=Hortaea werneckii TaxID=91943 RepID=A0A3M7IDN8_HORWE|nr:hypothetical protein D0859_12410 [Hortaea werneckii]
MANGWSLIISIIFIAVFSVAAWFVSPKGDTQTPMVQAETFPFRCGIGHEFWNISADNNTAITFLAQWHPLIVPERGDLRPEYNNGPVKSGRMF